MSGDTMPKGSRCPIGPLNLHTYNWERDECIWCGPNRLCAKPGKWIENADGTNAWSVDLAAVDSANGSPS